MFDQGLNTEDGVRYYLPQIPEIDGKYITGIEAHCRFPFSYGDLSFSIFGPGYVGTLPNVSSTAKYIFVYIKSDDKSEKNGYIPLLSLFNLNSAGGAKRVKPYYGKISTRDSFLTIPANSVGLRVTPIYVSLTFYYIQ